RLPMYRMQAGRPHPDPGGGGLFPPATEERTGAGEKKINPILIVGGGAARGMAAADPPRPTPLPRPPVATPDGGTVGVGEATIPALVDWIRGMKIDEDTFLRRCHGTYKLGIRFLNWIHPDHCYWHPFGLCGGHIDGIDLFHFWLKRKRAGRTD